MRIVENEWRKVCHPIFLNNPRAQCRRANDLLQHGIWPKRTLPLMPGAREYPVAGLPIPAGLLPHPEISGYTLIEWHRLARCFRLAIPSMSQINGAQDLEAHVGEINIAPFEGQQFATTESRCHRQQ